ncbi:protein MMS22-like isoform X2 [Lineus longissimus]|uniref:protein MMS22-like isoform X2 n=1 Tax=Lineus longissimus TaxID=88925 RepID=UPI00315D7E91
MWMGSLTCVLLHHRKKMSSDKIDEEWSMSGCCELFGHTFVTADIFINYGDKLFCFARQEISKVERLCKLRIGNFTGGEREIDTCEKHMKTFFAFLRWFLKTSSTSFSDTGVEKLMIQLRSLLLHVGPMSDLARHLIPCGNCEKNACFTMYHLHLNVYTAMLDIFNELEKILSESHFVLLQSPRQEDVIYNSISVQVTQLLLWNMVQVAIDKFHGFTDYLKSSFFPCEHAKDTWLYLHRLVDSKYKQDDRCDSFWVSLLQVYQVLQQGQANPTNQDEIDCDKFLLPPMFECKNPIGFSWWMLTHLTMMEPVAEDGAKKKGGGCYFLVSELLKKTLSKPETPEVALRCYLKCLLKISEALGPHLNIAIDLWDLYMYKHLNDTCYVPTLGMRGLSFTNDSQSPRIWLDKIKGRTKSPLIFKDSETSYDLFMRVLVKHLANSQDLSGWKQLKVRVFSKFHVRRLNELTELGLLNFSSLFLTLAFIKDFEDVSSKFSDFCRMLSLEKLDTKRQTGILRAVLTMILSGQELGFLCTPLLEYVGKLFQHITKGFTETVHDPSQHPQYWSLLTTYFDGIQEVLESCQPGHVAKYLISPGFSEILKKSSESELRYLLVSLQTLVDLFTKDPADARVQMDPYTGQEISRILWQEVYPFIKQHATTGTPPDHLADIAASFGNLSLSVNTAAGKVQTSTQFMYFATNENVCPSISCRYLCHMVASVPVMDQLKRTVPNLEVCLVQAWLRCCLLVPSDGGEQLRTLTRLILQHHSMKHLLPAAADVELNPIECVLNFFKDIGSGYLKLEGLLDKLKYREQKTAYFTGVTNVILGSLRGEKRADVMKKIFNICGHIVKWCPGLIYVKSKQDCVLPKLFECLILPQVLFDLKKPINQVMLPALREYLPLFISGLSKLDYRRDAYLQRQMKNIVCQYLQRFNLKSSSSSVATAVHPIVSSLKASLTRTPTDEAGQLQMDVVDIVVSNFMPLKGAQAPSNAGLGLNFCQEVVQRNLSPKQTAKTGTVLLPSLMDFSLLCDDYLLAHQARKILSSVLEAANRGLDENLRQSYSEIALNFFKTYIKGFQIRIFRVMEQLSSSSSDILIPIIKALTAEVKASELKRGVGADSQLRQSYIHLLRNLGEQGLEEVKLL